VQLKVALNFVFARTFRLGSFHVIVRVLYLVSPVTATVHVWSPTSYFGEHPASNAYVL